MWKDYFSFTAKEQRGILILCTLILLLTGTRFMLPVVMSSNHHLAITRDSLPAFQPISMVVESIGMSDVLETRLYMFNPNEVSYRELIGFGVPASAAGNWVRYLERGGRFRSKSDIGRVYGMDYAVLERISPFMAFEIDNEVSMSAHTNRVADFHLDLNRADSLTVDGLAWSKPMRDTLMVWQKTHWFPQRYASVRLKAWTLDSLIAVKPTLQIRNAYRASNTFTIGINTADTADWASLRGIGPVLSRRIVAYRKALGGFVSIEQIGEVEGISPVLLNDLKARLTLDTLPVTTININTASVRRLRDHPYLDFYQAKAIVDFRNENGKLKSTEQIMRIKSLESADWDRLLPYLSVAED
ncbi:helix-hairpin-helix domain-containing protein [Alkaliflexus imshenetskii]|uniref:helix-hairpin-helix domain-containing protein n=1 Tax=Alkaliflexus imshenetskii TaxID=286730 RepID=UPI0004B3D27C|nr:helix-hairpin-helix domain-containing protein [Alkaliflexus imshenetskii]